MTVPPRRCQRLALLPQVLPRDGNRQFGAPDGQTKPRSCCCDGPRGARRTALGGGRDAPPLFICGEEGSCRPVEAGPRGGPRGAEGPSGARPPPRGGGTSRG